MRNAENAVTADNAVSANAEGVTRLNPGWRLCGTLGVGNKNRVL
jgi:hypothetical protein